MSTQERIPGRIDVPTDASAGPETTEREPGKIDAVTVAIAEETTHVPLPKSKSSPSVWARAGWLLLITVAVWLLVKTGLSLWQLWQDFWWLALGLGGLSAAALLYLLRAVYGEVQASKRLDAVAERQQQIAQALKQEDMLLFNQGLKPVLAELQQYYPEQVQSYQSALAERETVASRMQLAENTWLIELDKQATRLINQEALTVAGGVALIPHPMFDAMLALWRSQRLIRRLGEVYGLRPTGLSSWKLLKMTLINTLIAGSIETATELAAEQLGYGVVESAVGKGAVQGAVMAQRMRRLGRQAQQLCRPWQKPS